MWTVIRPPDDVVAGIDYFFKIITSYLGLEMKFNIDSSNQMDFNFLERLNIRLNNAENIGLSFRNNL